MLALTTLLAAAAVAQELDPGAKAALTKQILDDRAETDHWLQTSPTSYLATILRKDFGDRATLTLGAAEDNDVRIVDAGVLPHHLRVTVVGDEFQVEAVDAAATFTVTGEPVRSAKVPSTSLHVGRFTIRLSHQRFPAIVVMDPQSPRFTEYKGIRFFPVDFAYRFVLPLTPNPKPDDATIVSTRGNRRHALRVGWFDFTVDGKPCRLEAHRLLEPGVGEKSLIVLFRDLTTGQESYAVGRYVDPVPLENGLWELDFNKAYNPACAYTDHFNCPLPPKANTLAVAIRAGEMDSHYKH